MHGLALVLAGFALVTLLLGWSRWLARRRLAATGHLLMAIAAASGALCLWPVANDLVTYEALARDAPVAEVHFEQTGSRRFRATLVNLPTGRTQVFEMSGDQWRIGARTLEWQGAAAQLGLAPSYRLERLSARHSRPLTAGDTAASSFALAATDGPDLWTQSRTSAGWGRYLAAQHATGPWRPMADGARFLVRMGNRTLQVVAANEAAAGAKPAG